MKFLESSPEIVTVTSPFSPSGSFSFFPSTSESPSSLLVTPGRLIPSSATTIVGEDNISATSPHLAHHPHPLLLFFLPCCGMQFPTEKRRFYQQKLFPTLFHYAQQHYLRRANNNHNSAGTAGTDNDDEVGVRGGEDKQDQEEDDEDEEEEEDFSLAPAFYASQEAATAAFAFLPDYLLIQSLLFTTSTTSSDVDADGNDHSLIISILFDYLVSLLSNYPRELFFHPLHQQIFLVFLTIAPKLAYWRDEKTHLSLIHYLCLMEHPDHLILHTLVYLYPASLSQYGEIGEGNSGGGGGGGGGGEFAWKATPLHLKLMKTEVNWESALYMLSAYPRSAR